MKRICILILLLLAVPLTAQETDRKLLERIQAEIAAHLQGGAAPPVQPPVEPPPAGQWGTNGPPPDDVPASMYPTWLALGADPGHPRGGYTCQQSVAHLRAHNGYAGHGRCGDSPAPPPPTEPPPPPPGTGDMLPPPAGPDASSWSGATIPVRLLDVHPSSAAPQGVAISFTAGSESRSFHLPSRGERTVRVPRGVDLHVTVHATKVPGAGVGGWGFVHTKAKTGLLSWGLTPDQISVGNLPVWDAFTNNQVPGAAPTPWGGTLRTWCGSIAPTTTPLPDWWRYTIPASISNSADYLIVMVLNRGEPRAIC